MNIQKDFKNDIKNKNKPPEINTPKNENVTPPPMTVENIIITVFSCVFVVMSIILIVLSTFTNILPPIKSYMLILISFCFLIFLIFSLIDSNPKDGDDEEKKKKKTNEHIFKMVLQTMYYIGLVCGILGLVGFICFNLFMFFGILGVIEIIDIVINIIITLISWIIFIPFSFLCLFKMNEIKIYYNNQPGIEEVSFPLSIIYSIVIVKAYFEEKLFTTFFSSIRNIPKVIRICLNFIYKLFVKNKKI